MNVLLKAIAAGLWAVIAGCGTEHRAEPEPDYRAEFMAAVIDPCVMESALYEANKAGLPVDVMAESVKAMQRDAIEASYAETLPLIRGQHKATRDSVYGFSLEQCVRGVRNARK